MDGSQRRMCVARFKMEHTLRVDEPQHRFRVDEQWNIMEWNGMGWNGMAIGMDWNGIKWQRILC